MLLLNEVEEKKSPTENVYLMQEGKNWIIYPEDLITTEIFL
jgi:hypothetical protein